MSIVRPTPAQRTRRLIVLAAAIFAVAIAYAQMALGWGQTPAEFAADGDATLRLANYAFSIWAVIHLALLIYAVRQALPSTGESRLISRLGWPSLAALLGIGWWIVAAAFDWEAATVVLIFGSLIALVVPLLIEAGTIRALPRASRDRWAVVWPLGLLAGWLTVAAPLNLITVATGNGDLPTALSPTAWAIAAIVVVAVWATFVTWRIRALPYALATAWGLIGAFVGEQDRNLPLACVALAAALAVLIAAIILAFRLKPGIEKAVGA